MSVHVHGLPSKNPRALRARPTRHTYAERPQLTMTAGKYAVAIGESPTPAAFPRDSNVPVAATARISVTSAAVCQGGAMAGSLRRGPDMIDAINSGAPVLAAGWSLLYMLFGGGIGGAIILFILLKAIGK